MSPVCLSRGDPRARACRPMGSRSVLGGKHRPWCWVPRGSPSANRGAARALAAAPAPVLAPFPAALEEAPLFARLRAIFLRWFLLRAAGTCRAARGCFPVARGAPCLSFPAWERARCPEGGPSTPPPLRGPGWASTGRWAGLRPLQEPPLCDREVSWDPPAPRDQPGAPGATAATTLGHSSPGHPHPVGRGELQTGHNGKSGVSPGLLWGCAGAHCTQRGVPHPARGGLCAAARGRLRDLGGSASPSVVTPLPPFAPSFPHPTRELSPGVGLGLQGLQPCAGL